MAAAGDVILSKATKDGRALEFRLAAGNGAPRRWVVEAYLAGQRAAYGVPQPLRKPAPPATHYLDGKQPVGLKADEAKLILDTLAALEEADRAAYAQTPEGRFEALHAARRALMAEHNGLVEDQRDAFDRRWAREDEGGAFAAQAGFEARIAAAAKAVADFDTAHPAVIARIRDERAAKTARFLAID